MNLTLNCGDFKPYLEVKGEALYDGVQYLFRFENDYGASVIKHSGSYGHEADLWELAVVKFNDDGDWDLCYSTQITDDVIGHLTDDEVVDLLRRIREL